MTPFVILLIVLSVFMHAGWNLLAREQRSAGAFLDRMLFVSVVVGFVPVAVSEIMVRSITPLAWCCVVGSGMCCAVYFYFLGRAYDNSDFTIVYPVTRAIPVVLVAFGDVLRDRHLTVAGWLGIILVFCGCFLAPLHKFSEFDIRRYLKLSRLWMLLAAIGTVGYTLLDKIASESVLSGAATAGRYGYVFFLFSWLFYMLLHRLVRPQGHRKQEIGWKKPSIAAVLNFGAYWLILWAYQLSEKASYISAFRQMSIILGVFIAFVIFKERGFAVRLTGTLFITVGLIFIGLWG